MARNLAAAVACLLEHLPRCEQVVVRHGCELEHCVRYSVRVPTFAKHVFLAYPMTRSELGGDNHVSFGRMVRKRTQQYVYALRDTEVGGRMR